MEFLSSVRIVEFYSRDSSNHAKIQKFRRFLIAFSFLLKGFCIGSDHTPCHRISFDTVKWPSSANLKFPFEVQISFDGVQISFELEGDFKECKKDSQITVKLAKV